MKASDRKDGKAKTWLADTANRSMEANIMKILSIDVDGRRGVGISGRKEYKVECVAHL